MAAAPKPAYRLIPSRFPPIGLFDTVATAADLEAVMELAGWTNDRLVLERVERLPRSEWVFGRPNSSIVMAAFLHVAPGGSRFNGPDLGAWYAAASLATAVAEVAHHLRREAFEQKSVSNKRVFRTYAHSLLGEFDDILGWDRRPEIYAPDSYAASQKFGETLRRAGSDGIIYDSVRHEGGICVCAYRPSKIVEVTQTEHYEISVSTADRRIEARLLTARE